MASNDGSPDTDARRIAMLIDGDNAQPKLLDQLLSEAAKHGQVTIRRIYGDWTTQNMAGWKEALHLHAVQPVQQFMYTKGKNSTDSALIIDAMDILYSGTVEGLCIVSSDSDYTRLATRARELGFFVMGVGEKKTPDAFVKACGLFVYSENLGPTRKKAKAKAAKAEQPEPKQEPVVSMIGRAIEIAAQEDGWALLSTVGVRLRQLDPAFDPRNHGFKQLSQLVRANVTAFEIRETKSKGRPSVIYIKAKE